MENKEEHISQPKLSTKFIWESPLLECLDIRNTLKDFEYDEEGSFWNWFDYGS